VPWHDAFNDESCCEHSFKRQSCQGDLKLGSVSDQLSAVSFADGWKLVAGKVSLTTVSGEPGA